MQNKVKLFEQDGGITIQIYCVVTEGPGGGKAQQDKDDDTHAGVQHLIEKLWTYKEKEET